MLEIEFHFVLIRKAVKITHCRWRSTYFALIHTWVMPNKQVGSAPSVSKWKSFWLYTETGLTVRQRKS